MGALGLRVAGTLRSAFASLTSGCWPIPPAKVSGYLSLIISKSRSLTVARALPSLGDVHSDLHQRLLLYRIAVRDAQSRALVDAVLETSPLSTRPCLSADCLAVLHSMRQADPDDHSLMVRSF